MRMSRRWALLAPLVLTATAAISSGDASASEPSITLGEVAVPPSSSGVDRATLKTAAEGELRAVDTSRLGKHRNVVVSVAIIGAQKSPYACTVNALLRDAKTGTILAILEGRARAEGAVNPELRNQVLRAAVRSAVRQIPEALAAN
jgi:hypothetical protein